MLRKLFKRNRVSSVRSLTTPDDLEKGDIIVLKPRSSLPEELQGASLEVTNVGYYKYGGQQIKDLSLRAVDGSIFNLSMDNEEGEELLCFSKKIPQPTVLSLFGGDEFALLWEEGFPTLQIQTSDNNLKGWLSNNYKQSLKAGRALYFENLDKLRSSSGDVFEYHECEAEDSCFGLTVEVWEDGETDVFLNSAQSLGVIEQMLPYAE